MNQEAIAKLEKALEIFSWCQERADEKWMVDHLMAVRVDIEEALTILKQQPAEGDFTKRMRRIYNEDVWGNCQVYEDILEFSDRLDRAEATNKDLLEALIKYGQHLRKEGCPLSYDYNAGYKCTCGLESAKAKKEGSKK